MKILVTGANGQLGRSIGSIAENYPHQRFVMTDLPDADITDRKCMESLVAEHRPGVIINCAAYTAVDKAETETDAARRINSDGPRVIAELSAEHSVKLVHISTDYVFSGEHFRPYKEDDPPCPAGVYGRTKLAGEQAVAQIGCEAAIIRTSWLYSQYGDNFVKKILRLASERESLSVVYDQIGTPTYAADLAHAIMHLIESGIRGCELYHFSNEGVASWYDFARAALDITNMDTEVYPVESSQFPTPARRPAYSVLSKEKIRGMGVETPYWRDSLKKCIENL